MMKADTARRKDEEKGPASLPSLASRFPRHASPITVPPSAFFDPLSYPLVSVALGALTVLGFAPFGWFPVPVLTLALLFRLQSRAPTPLWSGALGFAFGMGLFGAGASWVYVSIHDFGGMPAPLAALATFLFAALLALFPAGAGWAATRLPCGERLRWAIAAPAAWLLFEWLRGWVLTGFPWLALGYSQVPWSPLAGYAPVLGVYGVSLAVAGCAGLLAMALPGGPDRGASSGKAPRPWPWIGMLAGALLFGFALKLVPWTRPEGEPLKVALLQGNIPQEMKWRPERAVQALDTYARLALKSDAKLIVMPETALPVFRDALPASYRDLLAGHARSNGGDLLTGLPETDASGRAYYNSVVSFGSAPEQVYRKHHLVPFGEFVPPLFGWIVQVLHIPLSDFSRGPAAQPPLAVAGQKVAVSICYEDVFGEEVIRQLPEATLLVNVSNDAWFGRSLGPQQHQQIAQMRALETGRPMLRATNTGVTAFSGPDGHLISRAPEFETTTLTATVRGWTGTTPYVLWGNWLAIGLAVAGMLAAWLTRAFKIN